jgi:hypothetical protein
MITAESSENKTNRPLISFVMNGRNDGFMGDFNWRLATALNIMARSASRLGRIDDIELIVVDWNSTVPLHSVLRLVPEARRITNFVTVPLEIAEKVQKDTHFPDSIVTNTGIRRANGEFICQTGSDVVFTPSTLNAMIEFLEGRYIDAPVRSAFITGGRRHIPNGIIQRRLPLLEFEAYLNRNAAYFPEERGGPGHGAPTNLMMMHRDLWHKSRAFDERFIYWGFNDIDLALRITYKFDFIQLEHFGVNTLHMEHWNKPRDYSPEKMFRRMNPVDNLVPEFAPNADTWGLGDYEIPVVKSTAEELNLEEEQEINDTIWYGPIESIANSIGAAENQNVVKEVLQLFAHLPIKASEHPALICLSWYLANRKPRSFIELNYRYPHAASIVSRLAPGTELFAAVDWERRSEDDNLFYGRDDTSLVFFNNHALRQNNHWAYTHFIRNTIDDSNNQYDLAKMGPFDLVFIRAIKAVPLIIPSNILNQLNKGAVVIVTAETRELYQETIHRIRQINELNPIHFADGLNGLILI